MLPLVDSVLAKVDHAMDRILAVKKSSLPLVDTMAALDALANQLGSYKSQLLALSTSANDPEVVNNYCDIVLGELFKLLPHVGFLHRSRNASNPFELHGPLKRLAREFIGDDARLIISNEWEFSPFTHPTMSGIPGFVLLGLPASEASDNALLVPIVGHEMGHSVWKWAKLSKRFSPELDSEIFNQMRARLSDVSAELALHDESELHSDRAIAAKEELKSRALAQCEELFCDICGLLLFGESYCHAFAYLLAPGLIASQDDLYPAAQIRAEYLKEAGGILCIQIPDGFVESFNLPSADDLSAQIVNEAVDEQFEQLVDAANSHFKTKGLTAPSLKGIDHARDQLRSGRPVDFSSTLPEIICAAWELRLDPTLWKSTPQWLATSTEYAMLNELVLKSAESLEYWYRVANA